MNHLSATSVLTPRARALWAKTGDEAGWLNLPQHLLDSAGVAGWLWDHWLGPGIKQQVREGLHLTDDESRILFTWLAGTHDVGKASEAFEGQLEGRTDPQGLVDYAAFAERVRATGLPLRGRVDSTSWYPHSAASQVILQNYLAELHGQPLGRRESRTVCGLSEVAGAHHGLPPEPSMTKNFEAELDSPSGPIWREVQTELVQFITDRTEAEPILRRLVQEGTVFSGPVLMLLTGAVIIVDWIASNAELFPMGQHELTFQEQRVATGTARLNLPTAWSPQSLGGESAQQAYAERFGWPEHYAPRPTQVAVCEAVREATGPTILCMEAPMGNGKTEAALLAAENLAKATGRTGLIFAGPTMATTDSLFHRVAAWAEAVSGGRPASMYLGHSKNRLNEKFRSLSRNGIRDIEEDFSGVAGAHEGTVIAHQWLQGRKKGILSNFVVGTVDQVLFLALQSKHVMLRHLGLAEKVVVIDEVHAYDTYMNAYMQRALEWLGAYGVPVVLLSATLPPRTKAELITAYRAGVSGRRCKIQEVPDSGESYPALTLGTASEVRVIEVEQPSQQQEYRVSQMAEGAEALAEALAPVVEDGGCALVLCNTVTRAQEAYAAVKVLVGEDARLLHARFAATDRVAAEQELVEELGPHAHRADGRPRRRIVVATQVVEQSLDVDFDLMVTDIAPVDLLLQRAGRVHRHSRPPEDRPRSVSEPKILVRGFEEFGTPEDPPAFVGVEELIYPRSLLLGTTAALAPYVAGQPLRIPQDIPRLVREVYEGEGLLPEAWDAAYAEAETKLHEAAEESEKRAGTYRIPSAIKTLPGGFRALWQTQQKDVGHSLAAELKGEAQVRDTDPTVEVVVTQQSGEGAYRPLPWLGYADTAHIDGMEVPWEMAQDLAVSTVRLPHAFSYPKVFDAAVDQLERSTDEAWEQSPLLKGQLELRLDEEMTAELAGHRLRYDQELGLLDEGPTKKVKK